MPDAVAPRLARALRALALSLVNATLILLAACLFLAWQVTATVDRVGVRMAEAAAVQVARLAPLADEIALTRGEIAGLRADLAELGEGADEGAARLGATLGERLAEAEARLDAVSGEVAGALAAVAADPGVLVDRAVAAGVDRAGLWAAGLRGCTLPAAAPQDARPGGPPEGA
ncbi:hypothetical protein DLJ49_09710 [Rhodovulum sp. 12E13]|uniref:hypothetical protein n=1 Tax=Rhodovulum sp. 12E13 TaxID=2203891 RepID=UPI000E18F8F5|nr:hypothetical protein [Rhodovulum sp. 12E13]RDC72882.1 hypothetical protein DLJ49_09710 [Rhodovulum sp. 12E13]